MFSRRYLQALEFAWRAFQLDVVALAAPWDADVAAVLGLKGIQFGVSAADDAPVEPRWHTDYKQAEGFYLMPQTRQCVCAS